MMPATNEGDYTAPRETREETTETRRARRNTEMISQKYTDEISYKIIGCAIEAHKHLGPGLLESICDPCFLKAASVELRALRASVVSSNLCILHWSPSASDPCHMPAHSGSVIPPRRALIVSGVSTRRVSSASRALSEGSSPPRRSSRERPWRCESSRDRAAVASIRSRTSS